MTNFFSKQLFFFLNSRHRWEDHWSPESVWKEIINRVSCCLYHRPSTYRGHLPLDIPPGKNESSKRNWVRDGRVSAVWISGNKVGEHQWTGSWHNSPGICWRLWESSEWNCPWITGSSCSVFGRYEVLNVGQFISKLSSRIPLKILVDL